MRCGKTPYHVKDLCPAKDAVCHKCNRTGHSIGQCHAKTVLHEVNEDHDSDEGQAFLGAIDSNTQGWCTTVQILELQVKVKLDTGADVTVIPESVFTELFQMRMCQILEGLEGVVCHMDDILIFERSSEEHDMRTDAALRKNQNAGLTLNKKKSEFAKTEVKFLGHRLSSAGLQPDLDKLAAVQNMREPTNVSEVCSFLGMMNQLGKFIPELAEKRKPLRDLFSEKSLWS